MSKSTKQRFGVYYRSNGRWVGPYYGLTFTKYTLSRNPMKSEVRMWANYILKSRVRVRPVG